MIGVRLSYQLLDGEVVLTRARTLREQGVGGTRVLTLQTTMTPFSTAAPVSGAVSTVVFRGGSSGAETTAALRAATKQYREAIARAGLMPGE